MAQMTHDSLLIMAEETFIECINVMRAKNQDYTAGGGPFENFTTCQSVTGVDPVLGIMDRCLDKFLRIKTFAQKGELKVKAESVEDAIQDVINYMVLMKGVIRDEQDRAGTPSAEFHTEQRWTRAEWEKEVRLDRAVASANPARLA